MEIVLVRHAPTAWSGSRYCGRSDPPLTSVGALQAAELATRLAPTLPHDVRIVSSPSQRAIATGTAICRTLGDGRPLEIDDRWLETDFGRAEGRRFDDLVGDFPDLASSILAGSTAIDWPGGETAAALEARVRAAWLDLIATGMDAVVVTHAGPLLHAIALARAAVPDLGSIPAPATEVRFRIPLAGVARRPVLGSRP